MPVVVREILLAELTDCRRAWSFCRIIGSCLKNLQPSLLGPSELMTDKGQDVLLYDITLECLFLLCVYICVINICCTGDKLSHRKTSLKNGSVLLHEMHIFSSIFAHDPG